MRLYTFSAVSGLLGLMLVLLCGCQPAPVPVHPPSPPPATPVLVTPTTRSVGEETPVPQASPAPTSTAPTSTPADELAPFIVAPLPEVTEVSLASWSPHPYQGEQIGLPVAANTIYNAQVLAGLTTQEQEFLMQNGFVVIHSQEAQFKDIREQVAKIYGQPYYLTTDATLHAFHLNFDGMLKQIETYALRPQMIAITQAALDELSTFQEAVRSSAIEKDWQDARIYLSVGLKLMQPDALIDSQIADPVQAQVEQILAAAGREKSVAFPDFEDDYGAYKPVGHYMGSPELEQYFRGMTWYGRMHFKLKDPNRSSFIPSRAPLLITFALRKARVGERPASEAWAEVHQILTYLIGPTDDAGPVEYAALMDQVYGRDASLVDLADETIWSSFLKQSQGLPPPQINSTFVDFITDLPQETGWRFMGQRFTLDGLFFQNLIFDKVKPNGTQKRLFGSGLDIMAVLGSQPAYQGLVDQGNLVYPNYQEQLTGLQGVVKKQPESTWLELLYNSWLYSFSPLLAAKDGSYPAYMQTPAWSYKDLNTALGSWAELKHDTALYTKMPEGAGGGGPPMSDPPPSYVEPNPAVFYRLAYMAQKAAQLPIQWPSLDGPDYTYGMWQFAERLTSLGDIAAKELAGEVLTQNDFYAISNYLGYDEWLNGMIKPPDPPANELPHPAVIAAVAGAEDQVLEAGVGSIDRIYVVVPLEGKWQVAQGGVFSYYEFLQPRDNRLTDQEWRERLTSANPPLLPAWAENFILEGGKPVNWLAFRINDVYIITDAGDQLNVRASPGMHGEILGKLQASDYVQIVDGPEAQDGQVWWKVQCAWCKDGKKLSGWAVENQEWYSRSYIP